MTEHDHTLLSSVLSMTGTRGRLYYYQGNFFHPLELHGSQVGRVKRAIRQFARDNRQMIERDRADPAYRTLPELMDDQYE